jgi:hypothetical protein
VLIGGFPANVAIGVLLYAAVVPSSEESIICKEASALTDGSTPIPEEVENCSGFQQNMANTERRLSRRLSLRWRVKLSSPAIGILETRTENLSSRGFYCFLETPLVPGEVITCAITIPNYTTADREGLAILCQAEVIRVEALGPNPGFGVACRILDFTLDRRTGLTRN